MVLLKARSVLVVFVLILVMRTAVCGVEDEVILLKSMREDIALNFTQLAVKYGGVCEEHRVSTADGYVLTVFRLPGDRRRPVLLQHGSMATADDFVLRGRTSLAVALHAAGYDVWVGNSRGNTYSRRHRTLNPDIDKQFWEFTVQECLMDYVAMIDYILMIDQQQTLSAIAVSSGTQLFFALLADMPEYNKKLNVVISLAPICYTHNSPPLSLMYVFNTQFYQVLESLGVGELSMRTLGQDKVKEACLETFRFFGRATASSICFAQQWSAIFGYNPNEIEPEFTEVIMAHFPSPIGRKLMHHSAQIGSNRRFAKYDYGLLENLFRYGAAVPPEYDTSLITAKIVLISGKADFISTLADLELLKKTLTNFDQIVLEPETFQHADFMWGRNAHKILFPYIFDALQRYK